MKKTVIYAFFTFCCMVLIFCFSAQDASESDKTSDSFTVKVLSTVSSKFNDLDKEKQAEVVDSLAFPVRKAAHFSIYFVLGIFSALTFISVKRIKFYYNSLFAFLLCAFYSVSDEIHQYFVKGRSCEIRDMLIDSGAALLAVIIITAVIKIEREKKYAKEKAS